MAILIDMEMVYSLYYEGLVASSVENNLQFPRCEYNYATIETHNTMVACFLPSFLYL